MVFSIPFLDSFGRMFFPENWREPIAKYLRKAGYDEVPYSVFGLLFFVAIGITYIVFASVLVPLLKGYSPLVQGVASFIFWVLVLSVFVGIAALAVYFVLNMRIYKRVHEMEQSLPDYLQLVVTNLRSGMNFEQSLWSAARPEFGILSKEITLVSKRVMTGNDTSDALMEFVMRYDSPTLRRNFNLIISEIQSGGEIAKVIDRVISSLKKTKDLKEELTVSVLSYTIFISVIVIALAPALFAIANTLLGVIIGFANLLAGNIGSDASSLGAGASLIKKMAEFSGKGTAVKHIFLVFSYWALGLISFCSSLIVSIIQTGDIRGGLKYIPLFTISSLVLFTIFVKVLVAVFSGLVGT